MKTEGITADYQFLQGGGEMGELIRNFDWSQTSIGVPANWPQSLRTSVAILLSSKFPMFMFWGEEHIQFYNDAYRPSLGNNGKHPLAIGQKGIECWPEIWDFIYPIIAQVLEGKVASWYEDQLLPIFRNGKLEDVYWTFCYSALRGETGKVAGVLVVCQETTEIVIQVKKLLETNKRLLKNSANFINTFEKTSSYSAILNAGSEDYKVVAVTDDFFQLPNFFEFKRDSIIGKRFFDVFPSNAHNLNSNRENDFRASFEHVKTYKSEHHLPQQRYDIPNGDGTFSERYVTASNKPVLDDEGNVFYIVYSYIDVTEKVKAQKAIENIKIIQEQERTLRNIILQAPVAMCFLKGANQVIELANNRMFEFWGKSAEEVMYKPIFDVLKEAAGQGFEALLDNVYTTGEPFSVQGVSITLLRNGKVELVYINAVYEAYREPNGTVTGVIAMTIDVTEQVVAKLKIEESEHRFRALIEDSSVASSLYIGADFIVQYANDIMTGYWGKNKAVIGKPLAEVVPELGKQQFLLKLKAVYSSGNTYLGREEKAELSVNGKLQSFYFNTTYKAVRNLKGEIYGINHMAIDVTSQVLSRIALEESKANLHNTIMQSPQAMCFLRGPNHVVEIANSLIFEIWGTTDEAILHTPFFETMVKARRQGFEALLTDVYTTGMVYSSQETKAKIIRNGRTEEIYLNFMYEAHREINGEISGVIIRATEVTEKVVARLKVEESEARFRNLVLQAPVAISVFRGEDYIIETVNEKMLEIWDKRIEDVLNKPVYDALPEGKEFRELANTAYKTGERHIVQEIFFPLHRNGKLEDAYFKSVYEPLRDPNGTVTGIMAVISEITEQVVARKKMEAQALMVENMLMTAPGFVCTLLGPNHVYDLVNPMAQQMFGTRKIKGFAVKDILPELEGQGFHELLDNIYNTGETFIGVEVPVFLTKDNTDILEKRYLNLSYQPMYDENKKIYSILAIGHEVTEQVVARQKIEEHKVQLQTLFSQAPAAIAVLSGVDHRYTLVNPLYEKLFSRTEDDLLGKTLREAFPEVEGQGVYELFDQVFKSGESFVADEFPVTFIANGVNHFGYYDFVAKPIKDSSGTTTDIMVLDFEVTERVESRKKLMASEERFRNLVLQAPVAICVLRGENYVVETVNDKMVELWGRKTEEVINQPVMEALPELKDQGLKELVDVVYQTGERFVANELPVVIKRNGKLENVFVKVVYEPLRNENDTITGIMSVAHEITEQVVARKKIEEREHRFRTLIEESSVATALYLGPDIIVQYANDIMLGYYNKGKSIIGKPIREVFPEIEIQPYLDQLDAVYITGKAYTTIAERADKVVNGIVETSYFNKTYKALRNIDGEIYGIHHIALDVTSHVLSKMAVEESENNLRNTIIYAPVAMCIYKGPTFIVEIANNRMLELFGKTSEEVIDKPMFEALPEAKNQGFEELINKVYRTGERYSAYGVPTTLLRNGTIEVVYISFIYEAYREADGSISGVIGVATDVTDQILARQQIEEKVEIRTRELAETNINLQKTNSELEQFAYITSHDLQEPIRKITNFSHMLEQSLGDVNLKSKEYIDKINSSASRMLSLIRDVLNFSQLSKEGIVFEKVDLNKILENIKNDFDLMIEEKHAVVEWAGLPIIDGIALQMTQLFSNLLSNALKFTKRDGTPIITITASLLNEDEKVLNPMLNQNIVYYKVEFKDNGIGIDEKYSEQIFKIFQRLHGQSAYSGTGIGLALCKKIAQNHHGDIYITPTGSEQGTIFTVVLPEKINS